MKARRTTHLILIPSLLVALAGCALQPKADQSKFYILDSDDAVGMAAKLDHDGVAVVVGPSTVAKYLDQPQIVTMVGANRLNYSDTNRWGEPLQDSVNRILLDEIAVGLGTTRAGPQRIFGDFEWDYRVGYHVYQLGGSLGDKAELQVAWWVTSKDGESKSYEAMVFTSPVESGAADYTAYVKAIEEAVKQWGLEVVKTIDSMRDG